MTDTPSPPTSSGDDAIPSPADPCRTVFASAYSFIDGQMGDAERVTITTHLVECPPCKDLIDFELRLRVTVKRHCCVEAPLSLRDRIFAALELE